MDGWRERRRETVGVVRPTQQPLHRASLLTLTLRRLSLSLSLTLTLTRWRASTPKPIPKPNPKPNPHTNPNQVEGINKKEVRKYRQYMNRRGGFNRPLEEGGGSGF